MTDNRTNEPTDEQVEAAAKAMWERIQRKNDPAWGDLDYGVKEEYRKDARAALEAAQGAAPQAGSGDCPTSGIHAPAMQSSCDAPGYRDGWRCEKRAGHAGNHGVLTENKDDRYDWPQERAGR